MQSGLKHVLPATWSDMDFNRHMGNAAYLNLCTTVRLKHFADQGISFAEFERLRVGPVVFRDEVEYYREVQLLEKLTVHLEMLGSSDDHSQFKLRNEIWKENGVKAAQVVSTGGWLDMATRKLVVPPVVIRSALAAIPRGPAFEVLPSLIKL